MLYKCHTNVFVCWEDNAGYSHFPVNTNICIAFVQCWTNVYYVQCEKIEHSNKQFANRFKTIRNINKKIKYHIWRCPSPFYIIEISAIATPTTKYDMMMNDR